LARESEGKVMLLHVVEVITDLWDRQEHEFYERLERMAHQPLARLRRYFSERDVARHEEVVFGNRAQQNAPHAMESQVDLIVLASHHGAGYPC
jgi:nucleotide-binding universal stress UspA family protein